MEVYAVSETEGYNMHWFDTHSSLKLMTPTVKAI